MRNIGKLMTIAVTEKGKTMSDYIKREDAIEALQSCHKSKVCSLVSQNEALVNIEALPSANVAEVVRCKDCKWWDGIECQTRDIDVVDDDEFCSYGERKDNE